MGVDKPHGLSRLELGSSSTVLNNLPFIPPLLNFLGIEPNAPADLVEGDCLFSNSLVDPVLADAEFSSQLLNRQHWRGFNCRSGRFGKCFDIHFSLLSLDWLFFAFIIIL